MKISVIQDHLAAAGYLDSNFIEEIGEYDVWGPYTAAAYEQAVREILPPFMTYSDLEYVATNQPDGDLDINFVSALEDKAMKRGDALRKKSKRNKKKTSRKKTRARRAKRVASKKKVAKMQPVNVETVDKTPPLNKEEKKEAKEPEAKPAIITDKSII